MIYDIQLISAPVAKEYIIVNHYAHGCMNSLSPCYGLYDGELLIGVAMFATPISEDVRKSVFGKEHVD